ncbi:MAG: hypothetical protein EOO04_01245 [Chitinophagaceae bacterium]|nr:MAG: hypothetical protein EOO04_01245 [Chitinophagaceae bacterium]
MKSLPLASALFVVLISSTCLLAQDADPDPAYYDIKPTGRDYRMAIGLRLSNSIPTLNNSITGKYFVTDRSAIEGIISFGSKFGVGALLEIYKPFNTEGLSWFYGAGAYAGFASNSDQYGKGGGRVFVGPTGILGLDYKFPNVPVNLSLDWKPELDIVPAINFVPDAFALSVRFAFR